MHTPAKSAKEVKATLSSISVEELLAHVLARLNSLELAVHPGEHATNASATNAPVTNVPATNPPATNPPATNPPATNPPATNPPATNASGGHEHTVAEGSLAIMANAITYAEDTHANRSPPHHNLLHCASCRCASSDGEDSPTSIPRINPSERWYCVSKGRRVGVFKDWHTVLPLVNSVSGACYQRHTSKAAAEMAFESAVEAGDVTVIVT